MTHAPRAHFAMGESSFRALFDQSRQSRFRRVADAGTPLLIERFDDRALDGALAEAEVLVTSWGAPAIDEAVLERMPALRAVFHAAGSVRGVVSDALWERDILVTTAADANAVPVAEFTFAAIVLATKRTFVHARTARSNRAGWNAYAAGRILGNLGRTIGVVGFSRTGRRVIEKLHGLEDVRILVADPVADPARVAAAGAELTSLDELLTEVDVLTLHAPALPSTQHMIGARQLATLRDGAVLINTARGAIVDHDALAAECATGRIDAVLDVTDPEPLPESSPLLDLPNVAITPHIAGSIGGETRRLADAALDELEAYASGRAASHPVRAGELGVTA